MKTCSQCGKTKPLGGVHNAFMWCRPTPESEMVLWCRFCAQKAKARRFSRKGMNGARRMARARGLPVENFKRVQVGRRDQWICGICHEPVDPETPRLDPETGDTNGDYQSLDHIIPVLSPDYPGHIWSNVQISHHKCNMEKGSQTLEESQ